MGKPERANGKKKKQKRHGLTDGNVSHRKNGRRELSEWVTELGKNKLNKFGLFNNRLTLIL